MLPRIILVLVSLGIGTAQEPTRTRVRFPTELNKQGDLGPQLFESESQVQPVIITAGNGLLSSPHYVLPKVPSLANPFGQVGDKGFAEGIIIPYQHAGQNEQEFHQSVPPPPQQQAYYIPGYSSAYYFRQESPQQQPNHGKQPVQQQQNHAKQPGQQQQSHVKPTQQQHNYGKPAQQYQQTRPQQNRPSQQHQHRFSPQRLTYNQLKQLHPTQHAKQQIYASGMHFINDGQEHPDVASYRYSIVTNHGPPKASSPDEFEMEINHGVQDFPTAKPYSQTTKTQPTRGRPQSTPYSSKVTSTSSHKPKTVKESDFSDDFFDFDQGIPDWQVKANFDYPHTDSDVFFDKKKKGSRQRINNYSLGTTSSKKPNTSRTPQNNNSGTSANTNKEQKAKRNYSNNFSNLFNSNHEDFVEFSAKDYNRYFPNRGNSNYKRGEVKSVSPPARDSSLNGNKGKKNPTKSSPNFESFKSIEPNDFPHDSFPHEFDFHEPAFKNHEKQASSNYRYGAGFQQKPLKKFQKQQSKEEFDFDFDFPEHKFKNENQHSNENFDFEFDFPQKKIRNQANQPGNSNSEFDFDYPDGQSSDSNSGSEWIPINAPEGAVPAKSYNIPAPDLSRTPFQEKKKLRRENTRGEVNGGLIHDFHNRGNSEGVVSAVFRVKQ